MPPTRGLCGHKLLGGGHREPCGRPAALVGSWPASHCRMSLGEEDRCSATTQHPRRAQGEREGNGRLFSICASVCLSMRPPLQHIHQSLHPSIPRTHLLLHPAICPSPGAVNLSVSASPTRSCLPQGLCLRTITDPPQHGAASSAGDPAGWVCRCQAPSEQHAAWAPPAPLPQHPCARCCSDAKTPGPSRSTAPRTAVPAGTVPATRALGEEDTLPKHRTAPSRCPGAEKHPLPQPAAMHGRVPRALAPR